MTTTPDTYSTASAYNARNSPLALRGWLYSFFNSFKTRYFQRCQEEGEVIYFGRRIKFNGKTPYFASMLVIFNGSVRGAR